MGSHFFVGAYLALQLAVALFSFRYWPFTDYPMFSIVHRRFEKIESFRLRGVRLDGTEEWLHRGVTANFGHADFKIRANLKQGDIGRARELLVEHLRFSLPWIRENYLKIVVVERKILRLRDDFEVEDRILFEIPVEGLHP